MATDYALSSAGGLRDGSGAPIGYARALLALLYIEIFRSLENWFFQVGPVENPWKTGSGPAKYCPPWKMHPAGYFTYKQALAAGPAPAAPPRADGPPTGPKHSHDMAIFDVPQPRLTSTHKQGRLPALQACSSGRA